MIPPEQRAEIRRLFYAEHWRVGTIASTLGVHPDTVRRAIEHDRFVRSGSQIRPSMLDPYKAFITATLDQYPLSAVMQNSPPVVTEISPPSSRGGSRNVDRDGEAGRDHRRRGHSLRGGADGPPGEVGGEAPPVGRRAGADRRDCAPLGSGSQDRPTLPARYSVAAVSPAGAAGHAADTAR